MRDLGQIETLFRVGQHHSLIVGNQSDPMAATEFTFLTVDGHGRPLEPGSRASIRSRCMKGVNVRQDSRRSRRKARKASENGPVAQSTRKSIELLNITSSYQSTSCGPLVKSLQLRTDELGFDSSRLPSSILRSGIYKRYSLVIVSIFSNVRL